MSEGERCRTCQFLPCRCQDLADCREMGRAHTSSCWPMVSEALAYHPAQIPEAHAHLEKLGVPTEINSMGQPILRDREHRRRLMRALKVHDRRAGYKD